jgi:hypothetical protein
MSFRLRYFLRQILATFHIRRHLASRRLVSLVVLVGCLLLLGTPEALAGLNDDKYDGNIFALYAGNGALIAPRMNFAESLKQDRPTLLVLYVDDSSDCKQYATVVSNLQAPYGRAANFMPVNIDSLPVKSKYEPTEPGYYYKGLVPQTVLIDQKGKVVLNETGQLAYERIDDAFRQVFDLLPRSESVELKRRTYNEINTELTPSDR